VNRVEGRGTFDGVPFAFGKPKIIIRIDDGVFTSRERYPAERVAVPNQPVEEDWLDHDPNQPERDGKGKLNLADSVFFEKLEALISKSETNSKSQCSNDQNVWISRSWRLDVWDFEF